METVAVFTFGISWLVKGEATKDISEIKNKIKEITVIGEEKENPRQL